MKKLVPFIVMLFLSFPFLACKKGEVGPAGAPGEPGAVPKYYEFTVRAGGGDYLLPNQLADDDFVLVYFKNTTSTGTLNFTNLPGIGIVEIDSSGQKVPKNVSFSYLCDGRRIKIISDATESLADKQVTFRVVVIKGEKARKANVNPLLLRYDEIMKLHN